MFGRDTFQLDLMAKVFGLLNNTKIFFKNGLLIKKMDLWLWVKKWHRQIIRHLYLKFNFFFLPPRIAEARSVTEKCTCHVPAYSKLLTVWNVHNFHKVNKKWFEQKTEISKAFHTSFSLTFRILCLILLLFRDICGH